MAAALRSTGATVATSVADISEPEAPARLVEATVEAFGALDIVIANAGGPPPGRSLEVDDAQLLAAVNANLLSAVRLIRHAVPLMRQTGWGRICCISSYSVVQPIPTLALSNTARAGLRAWAKTAAHDLAEQSAGITLNLVCPGPHATGRMRELGGGDGAAMGDPSDFGRVAAFLCSQPAGFINGATIVVDGGTTLAL
jgi:3-oxoacyl-[acyl-carrier protein] reductase